MKQLPQPIKKTCMFLQNSMNKKITITALFVLISFTILAQDAPATKTVTSGNNLLAILLITTTVILAFVIWGLGQVLIALSRQLLDKNKTASKILTLSLLVILSLISGNLMAQDAVKEELVKVIPNYGGLSATTFYLCHFIPLFFHQESIFRIDP
jgi:hypothetical protein